MQQLLETMSPNQLYKTALSQARGLPANRLKSLKLLTPAQVQHSLEKRATAMHSEGLSGQEWAGEASRRWEKGESMVFEWVAACFSFAQHAPI